MMVWFVFGRPCVHCGAEAAVSTVQGDGLVHFGK